MKQVHRIFFIILCLFSYGTNAQWAWVDKDGKKVFSDRAPSADISEKNILKRPGRNSDTIAPIANSAVDTNDTEDKAAATAKATSKPAAGVDKELAERIKKTEQDQAAKKKADDERVSKAKADNCQRARLAQKNLDSGIRLSRVNAQGEREILDDSARAVESKRLQGVVESECK